MSKPYSVASLSEHWGCSDTFIYNLCASGALGHIRLGAKLIRIPVDAVEEYERQQMHEAALPQTPAALPVDPVQARRERDATFRLMRPH